MNKTTICTARYDRAKKTEESGIFQPFGLLGAIFTRGTEPRLSVAKRVETWTFRKVDHTYCNVFN